MENEVIDQLPVEEIQEQTPDEYSLTDLKEGKLSLKQFYKELPHDNKKKILDAAREDLPDDEAREAFDMGWRPKEFFIGKKADGSVKEFVDYRDFLNKIKSVEPVRNERLRAVSKENEELKKALEEQKTEMRKFFELQKMSQESALQTEEEKVQAEIQEAEDLGDIQRFKIAQAKLQKLEQGKLKLKSFEIPVEAIPQAAQAPQIQPEVQEWAAKNQWFFSNQQVQNFSIAQDNILAASNPELSTIERLDRVKEMAKVAFPDLFPIARQTVMPTKTTGFNSSAKSTMTFEQLPDHEKSYAEKLIKMGVYKNKSEVVQAYLKREGEKKKSN